MSITFNVMSEEQAEKERGFELLDNGIYTFEVLKAEEKTSSSGNPMIEMDLLVWNLEGREFIIRDYIVFTSKMMWKVIHFCNAVGMTEQYKSGSFDAISLTGKGGKAEIFVQKGKKKPDGGFYNDRNSVSDYFSSDKNLVNEEQKNNTEDYLPF